MKITRDKAISYIEPLNSFFQEKVSVQSASLFLKNKKIAVAEKEQVEELKNKFMPLIQKLQEYETKRIDTCKNFAVKDEEGNPVNDGRQWIIAEENQTKFDEELKRLQEEYKEVLEENKKLEEEFIEFLKEELDLPFQQIPLSLLPEKVLPAQLEALDNLILIEE